LKLGKFAYLNTEIAISRKVGILNNLERKQLRIQPLTLKTQPSARRCREPFIPSPTFSTAAVVVAGLVSARGILRWAVVRFPPRKRWKGNLVYDGGFPSLKAARTQRGNPGPNPGGRTTQPTQKRLFKLRSSHHQTHTHNQSSNSGACTIGRRLLFELDSPANTSLVRHELRRRSGSCQEK